MKLNLENGLFFYLEVKAKILRGGREGSTILRVYVKTFPRKCSNGVLKKLSNKAGLRPDQRKKFVFVYLIIPLNIYINLSNKRYVMFILSAALI